MRNLSDSVMQRIWAEVYTFRLVRFLCAILLIGFLTGFFGWFLSFDAVSGWISTAVPHDEVLAMVSGD